LYGVIDSWHSMEHVYKEMLVYSELVKSGGYMIVEDSHAAGNPVPWEHDDLVLWVLLLNGYIHMEINGKQITVAINIR
jgi:cephalosporin hydroxylase